MNRSLLFIAIIFLFKVGQSQVLKYHRVLISCPVTQQKLLNLGVTVDHSHTSKDGIEAEISESEIEILKFNHIPYKILIKDLSTYYRERNAADLSSNKTAAGVCNAANIQKPSHFHLGSMGGYFTLVELENILDSMALLYPNLVKSKQPISTVQSFESRNIWYVKFSDNPNVDENEPEVMYTSLHHAREGASLSQLIFYMWYVLENYATDPDIQATLNNTELFFVPCVNPDGYVYNQTTDPNGGGMWRRNRRLNSDNTFGVDLNRNYGFNWGYDNVGSSPSTASDVYRGTAAFSEPETQAMQNFCNTRQFKNALNAHTFGNVLIYPWGYIPGSYTPDSATYVSWGTLLTRDTRFLYGTCDQTLNYTTNGSADDWMYGEQTSKPKIISMTPEAGTYNDGFWPPSSRIIDICKTTFTQNYNLARLAGNFGKIYEQNDKFISGNGYIKYKLQRLGLSSGSFTLSVVPIGTGLATVGPPKFYTGLTQNQIITDSIAFTLSPGLVPAQTVRYAISVHNGSIARHDTIARIYGSPVTVLYDNGSSAVANFDTTGSWGLSTTKFVSPPSGITDSPFGTYFSDDHKMITTKGQLSLANASYAHLQYYTRFEVEKTFDEVQVQISLNNGNSYSPLCGKYETSPASFGGTYPVYDGRQDEWVKEDIDLSQYAGQNIKIRFKFDADFYDERDGFYFDDLLVRKIGTGPVGLNERVMLGENLVLYPNPSSGIVTLMNSDGREIDITIYNAQGQMIFYQPNIKDHSASLDLSDKSPGLYFVKLRSGTEETFSKILIVR